MSQCVRFLVEPKLQVIERRHDRDNLTVFLYLTSDKNSGIVRVGVKPARRYSLSSKVEITQHASERVFERLALNPTEVALLVEHKSIPVGRDRTGLLVYSVFYSVPDDDYAIAVQDERTGEVLTVLPVNFGKVVVSLDTLAMAKELAVPSVRPELSAPSKGRGGSKKTAAVSKAKVIAPPPPPENPNRRVFVAEMLPDRPSDHFMFYLELMDEEDGGTRRVKIGHVNARKFDDSLAAALASKKVRGDLKNGWARYATSRVSVRRFYVQKGHSGPCIDLDLSALL